MVRKQSSLKKISIAFVKLTGLYRIVTGLRSVIEDIEKERLRSYACIHPSVILNGRNIRVTYPEKLSMGEGSGLHDDTYLETTGGLTIGRYVHVGRGFTVFTTNHNYRSERKIPYDEISLVKPVVIEDFVWIGANVSIVPGITIGEGAVLGMGSVVVRDVPKYAIVGGNPAEILSYRDEASFEKIKASGEFF